MLTPICNRAWYHLAFVTRQLRNLLVEEPEHYLFSSARNYAGLEGLLDVELL